MGNSSNKQSKKNANMSKGQPGGYPSQGQGYPSQGQGYPSQGQGYPAQGQGYPAQPPVQYQHQAPQGYSAGNPPPYAGQPIPQGHPGYMQTAPGPHYAQQLPPPAYNPQMVMVQGGFEAGARFDVGATPNIPPPPPGCAPNAAQYAASQGHNVVMSQQKGGFMSGTGDGGYTVW